MILLIDHDDSFVHVLASYLSMAGRDPVVIRDSRLDLDRVREMAPDGLILSPGPGRPDECTLAISLVRELGATTPTLGVCLGHQVIAHTFGATVSRSAHPLHGMTSPIEHDGRGLFSGLVSPTAATRYHSLSVDQTGIPDSLIVSARSDDGEIMGLRHREWPVEGVQFHPESVLTADGRSMIENWVVGLT